MCLANIDPANVPNDKELDAAVMSIESHVNRDLKIMAAQLAMFSELVDALSAAHDRAEDGNYSGSAQKHIYSLLERARRLLEQQP